MNERHNSIENVCKLQIIWMKIWCVGKTRIAVAQHTNKMNKRKMCYNRKVKKIENRKQVKK